MNRIYEAAAYAPLEGCWWQDTVDAPVWPRLSGDTTADVVIIGGGFTGLSAAFHLATQGASVRVLEAQSPGFGASGRNGGFCCLGGANLEPQHLDRAFGASASRAWADTELAAVACVDDLIARLALDVDRHSEGETLLAHTPKAWRGMQNRAKQAAARYGATPVMIGPEALRQHGMNGPFHGAMTLPIGFALNPRKYLFGLAHAAQQAGASLHSDSPATALIPQGDAWRVESAGGSVTAQRVILATNGYSSEDLPAWMRSRYLPVQSSVIVTRPLTSEELDAQGWRSRQMSYDSRTLLHYFRLMPDNRFLFGMRGGRRATPAANTRIARQIRADFKRMFPAWGAVEITHNWQGLVCMTADFTPFCGHIPQMPGVLAGFGYHGNGVAMGTYTGKLLAGLALDHQPSGPFPAWLGRTPGRFPLGRFRRALLAPVYLAARAFDL